MKAYLRKEPETFKPVVLELESEDELYAVLLLFGATCAEEREDIMRRDYVLSHEHASEIAKIGSGIFGELNRFRPDTLLVRP